VYEVIYSVKERGYLQKHRIDEEVSLRLFKGRGIILNISLKHAGFHNRVFSKTMCIQSLKASQKMINEFVTDPQHSPSYFMKD
jgi:hypothetical protein